MTEMHDLDSALQDFYIVQTHPDRQGDAQGHLNKYFAYIYNRQAIAVFERKEYKTCLGKLEEALLYSPHDASIIKNRAEAYFLMNELDSALEDYERVLEMEKDQECIEKCALILYKQAISFMSQGKYTEAQSKLDRGIQLTPENLDLYYERARVYFYLQEVEKCRLDIARVLQGNPDHVKAVCLSTLLEQEPFMEESEGIAGKKKKDLRSKMKVEDAVGLLNGVITLRRGV